jgi:hypothetical protein
MRAPQQLLQLGQLHRTLKLSAQTGGVDVGYGGEFEARELAALGFDLLFPRRDGIGQPSRSATLVQDSDVITRRVNALLAKNGAKPEEFARFLDVVARDDPGLQGLGLIHNPRHSLGPK